MKDKLNRTIATGLLVLMLANFTACGKTNPSNTDLFGNNDHNNDAKYSDVVDDNNNTSSSNTGNKGENQTNADKVTDYGDVFNAMKAKGRHHKIYMEFEGDRIKDAPIPIQFLIDEGLLYYDQNGDIGIIGKQPGGLYRPFNSDVFVDENTDANDVYVIVQYSSDVVGDEVREDVYHATWKLKYTLDDADYKTLIKFTNDARLRYFVQEMDNIYEPEVVAESIVTNKRRSTSFHSCCCGSNDTR